MLITIIGRKYKLSYISAFVFTPAIGSLTGCRLVTLYLNRYRFLTNSIVEGFTNAPSKGTKQYSFNVVVCPVCSRSY